MRKNKQPRYVTTRREDNLAKLDWNLGTVECAWIFLKLMLHCTLFERFSSFGLARYVTH